MRQETQWKFAAWAFALALVTFWVGVVMAARLFPDPPFDWMYRVVSGSPPASTTRRADAGSRVPLGLSMLALWPVVSCLRETVGERRWPIIALRAGILFGVAGRYPAADVRTFFLAGAQRTRGARSRHFRRALYRPARPRPAVIPARLDRRAGRGGAAGRDLHHAGCHLLRPARPRLGRPPLA